MNTDPDDALRWEGDESEAPSASATQTPRAARPATPALEPPAEAATVAAPEPTAADASAAPGPTAADSSAAPLPTAVDGGSSADSDDGPAGTGNAALVFYGIIGGVYLLFAVGWIVGGFRLRPRASLLLVDWMYFPWMWLAALAPVLWFAAAWVLTRGRATWIRIVALIAGAVLLVPWPFVMFGTVGS